MTLARGLLRNLNSDGSQFSLGNWIHMKLSSKILLTNASKIFDKLFHSSVVFFFNSNGLQGLYGLILSENANIDHVIAFSIE